MFSNESKFEKVSKTLIANPQKVNESHHAIGGMTPAEMHTKKENYCNDSFITSAKEARKERVVNNKCNACGTCTHNKELKII